MKKNDIIEQALIEKVGYEGIWIAKFHDGKKLIVKWWALPGMICDLRVVKSYKDYAECHIVEIHSFAPEYKTENIKCPHYLYSTSGLPSCKTGCGGCKWQIAWYDKQLELKYSIVKDSFRHYPHEIEIRPVLATPKIRGYRNKIEYSFGKFISGRKEEKEILSDRSLGFHRQGMFGKIVDIDQCFLVDKDVNDLFNYIKNKLKEAEIPVYDQMMHDWILRHLMIRQAKRNNQIMVILSAHSRISAYQAVLEWFVNDEYLRSKITTFVLIINDGVADVVATRDSEYRNLRWDGVINETMILNVNQNAVEQIEWWANKIIELNFDISPQSFFQTNSTWAELLYSTAIWLSKSSLWEDNTWAIMDLYCGTGTIWLSFCKAWIGSTLLWVEEIAAAIDDAKKNAVRNAITSDYHFYSGRVEKICSIQDGKICIENWIEKTLTIHGSELKMIIVDPPRSWLHQTAVDLLLMVKQVNPALKVCYISCNPVTLARDMKLLSELYTADFVQPVDMFPHTHHIENITILN
jgi:23S rRNA (uracil1939-C5)-methyltransferase